MSASQQILFSNNQYLAYRIASGTDEFPTSVKYYSKVRAVITAITSDATDPEITVANSSGFQVGQSIFIQGSDSDASIDGSRIIDTVEDTLTFTINGVNTTTSSGTVGFIFDERYLVNQIDIDSYDTFSNPVYLGQTLENMKLNVAEGRFVFSTSRLSRLNGDIRMISFLDSKFTSIVQTGHTHSLTSTKRDLNNSDNPQWLNVAVGTILSIVSTSALDGGAGAGISTIVIAGLDANLDLQTEAVSTNGLTPVLTIATWRALNTAFAITGGVNGAGASGEIAITSVNDGTQWSKFLVGETSGPPGRYTVPRLHQFSLHSVNLNSGVGGDATVQIPIQQGAGYQFAIGGEVYVGGGIINVLFGNFGTFIEGGTTIFFRSFSNSGNPFQRFLSATFVGILALTTDWDSYKINP